MRQTTETVGKSTGTVGTDFQHSLPPDDRLTGGASLRDYFAAQALRSHWIIGRTKTGAVAELVDLCDEIADRFMSRPERRPPPAEPAVTIPPEMLPGPETILEIDEDGNVFEVTTPTSAAPAPPCR